MYKSARKRRTREHVIADLSINHVERIVLRCGYTVERFWHDYGFDLLLNTYDNNGEYENGDVCLQVKATDIWKQSSRGRLTWRLEWAHLRHWLNEPMPVVLIVYNAPQDEAYWLYVQHYFEMQRLRVARDRETTTVKIPTENQLNENAVRQFARFRDRVLSQAQGVIRHHE